ncbi:hypothetical protein D3C78_1617490 [compost metagenome]
MIRRASIPWAIWLSIRAMTVSADSSSWALSMARAGCMARMSYQLGAGMPLKTVTGRVGACGRMKRVRVRVRCSICATGWKS